MYPTSLAPATQLASDNVVDLTGREVFILPGCRKLPSSNPDAEIQELPPVFCDTGREYPACLAVDHIDILKGVVNLDRAELLRIFYLPETPMSSQVVQYVLDQKLADKTIVHISVEQPEDRERLCKLAGIVAEGCDRILQVSAFGCLQRVPFPQRLKDAVIAAKEHCWQCYYNP